MIGGTRLEQAGGAAGGDKKTIYIINNIYNYMYIIYPRLEQDGGAAGGDKKKIYI